MAFIQKSLSPDTKLILRSILSIPFIVKRGIFILNNAIIVVFIFFFKQRGKNKCTFIRQTVVYFKKNICCAFCWHELYWQSLCLDMWYCNAVHIHGVAGKHWTVGSYRGGEKGKWHWEPFYASFGKRHCNTHYIPKNGILNSLFAQKDFSCLNKSNGRMHMFCIPCC